MKFLHTADLHIGKTLNGISLLSQQKHCLNQIIDYLKSNPLDFIIIAGDIYDKSIPNKEAIQIVNEFIHQLINEIKIPTYIITGNHDSSERLSFLSSIVKKNNLFIIGEEIDIVSITQEDYTIHLNPYHDYLKIKHHYQDNTIIDSATALKKQLQNIKKHPKYNIFVAHHYFKDENTRTTDSERVLNIGGEHHIDVELLKDFDYVALGHLHQSQSVKYPHIRYSGSIYPYSESEVELQKSFTIVELNNDISIETIPFQFEKNVRIIKGDFASIITQSSHDYIYFHLTDTTMIIDAMQRLNKQYPNAVGIKYIQQQQNEIITQFSSENINIPQLLEDYFFQTHQKIMSNKQKQIIQQLLEKANETT